MTNTGSTSSIIQFFCDLWRRKNGRFPRRKEMFLSFSNSLPGFPRRKEIFLHRKEIFPRRKEIFLCRKKKCFFPEKKYFFVEMKYFSWSRILFLDFRRTKCHHHSLKGLKFSSDFLWSVNVFPLSLSLYFSIQKEIVAQTQNHTPN